MLIKHGVKMVLVNFYKDDVGNPALPNRCKEAAETPSVKGTPAGRRRNILISGTLLGLMLAALGYFSFTRSTALFQRNRSPLSENIIIPEKSIAVLPFQSLSDDKQHTYFADGVQDEILTSWPKSRI